MITTRLALPPIEWEQSSNPEDDGRLYAVLDILGIPHHLEAVPVQDCAANGQEGRTPIADEMLDGLYLAFGGEGAFSTVEIDGQEFALFMSPFCR